MSDFTGVVASGEDDELLRQACVLIQSSLRGHLARVQFKQRRSRSPRNQKIDSGVPCKRGRPKGSKNKKTLDREAQARANGEALETSKKKRGRPSNPPMHICKRPRGRPYGSKAKQKVHPPEAAPNPSLLMLTTIATSEKPQDAEVANKEE